jgi:RNA polymerase II subunit A-like phosphatase
MGKPLSLGKKLKYPITVNKLLKSPGDSFAKGDAIFEYSFKWKKEVGDAFGDKWEEEITTIVSFASTADGKLLRWQIRPGMVINNDQSCAEIDETCSHAVQYAGLCALCGKDMNETSWATDTVDAQRAQINMIHDQTLLSVSQDEASRAEEQLQRRLLKNRKLSLVVDLDQTIIHACIEPTIGEWQRDPTSPNYEAVKDVKSFQLHDDGPRGLASGCWYYIKMRPGLAHFLATIAEKYELHVYTMGTRAYAQEIAKIVDPEHKLFGDRIISRDENGSLTAKTLSRLFPVDTKMVVIIDDRADVWPRNRSNLIKVVPYDFFIGIGDINSSFLPKREETPKVAPVLPPIAPMPDTQEAIEATIAEEGTAEGEAQVKRDVLKSKATSTDTTESMSALEELVAMGGGDDPTVREIQAQEQAEFLEKQLKERPLLHMQQQLDKEDNAEGEEAANGTAEESENTDEAYNHHRHHLLKDDDNELAYLENHLLGLHRTFYEQYDKALINAKGDRVAHLRPGATKKVHMKDETADLQIVPDIGEVMPQIK